MMDKNTCLENIDAALHGEAILAKRNEFKEAFGSQFELFFQGIENAIDELHSTNDALPLFLLDTLPEKLIAQLRELSPESKGLVAKELVTRGLARLAKYLDRSSFPLSIIQQYPTAIEYMVNSISGDPEASYGNEVESYFDRDLRMAFGFTVPAGAQVVDLRCWLPTNFYRYQGIIENFRCLSFVKIKLGGLGPLFRIHTDTRNLVEFNQSGWNDCYVRIAELLESMPRVKGVVGTSWFYDPQLENISPKLRYLRKVPTDGGAFLRIDGPGDVHTQRAITRSPTRKQLYEEGKYEPICATLVWPRKNIIQWSKEM